MHIEITGINWSELARRYNNLTRKDLSFDGSSAYLVDIEREKGKVKVYEVAIDLCISSPTTKPYIYQSSSNVYRLTSDLSGNLEYCNTRSDRRGPRSNKNIAIGSIELVNIIPDYIQTFLRK